MKAIVCFAAFLAVASAASCPTLSPVAPFEVKDFMGTWYQQYSINTFIMQGTGHCAKAEYTYNEDNDIISIVTSEKTMFGGESTVQGSAVLAEPTLENGKLEVTLETILGEKIADVLVLATDYKNYAILWSCQDIFTIPYESAWTLTREEILSDDVNQQIQAAWETVAQHGGPKEKLWVPTSQENCF